MKKLLIPIFLVFLLVLYGFPPLPFLHWGTTYETETVTCASDAGTANPKKRTSFLVTDGGADTNEDTVSLADGTLGEEKVFVLMTLGDVGDSVNVTPTNFANTKIVFDTVGQGCIMVFDGTNWNVIANNGGTIS